MSAGSATTRVFVYGTLREDAHNEMYQSLAGASTLLGDASVNGDLYDLGAYPGLLLTNEPSSVVHGEVYELKPDRAAQLIAVLDEYEGCGASAPAPHEYKRELIRVRLENGETTTAWAYLLNRDPAGLNRIPGGDYLSWRRQAGAA
ncbi:MAG TPA: gamma-glutamylcyclotransferase family protein [Blastocatellia bacterium]|nr:gamma-glutamylcyclotransferase family protein [Blastocatellia bacterium]